jgi:Carboxylesterase family
LFIIAAAIRIIFIHILNFDICASGSLEFRQNDSMTGYRESQSSHANDSNIIVSDDVLLAHGVMRLNDEHATDAKRFEKRSSSSSSSFVPVNNEAGSMNRNFFREMLNRRNDDSDNIVEYTANPSYSNYRRYGGTVQRYTREVHIKQGQIVGTVREMSAQMRLKNVDQFLGIPYAEAPVDSRRFMPPSTPLPWQGIKYANKLESVCPQVLPDLSDPSGYNKGRYDQIKRLLPFLKTESEDCLYLNLYVPSFGERFSFIIYLLN